MNIPKCIDLNSVKVYIGDYDYYKEIDTIKSNKDAVDELKEDMSIQDVFDWCIKYAFVHFCKYLYIFTDVEFTSDSIARISLDDNKEEMVGGIGLQIPITTDGGCTNIKIESMDEIGQRQSHILAFMYNMRKYSKCGFKNKKHIWRLNKKYVRHIVDTYLI